MKKRKVFIFVTSLLFVSSCSGSATVNANQAYYCEPSAKVKAEMLRLINQARAVPRHCGWKKYNAAPPVTWNNQLAVIAKRHSDDMAKHNFFSHNGSDGRQVDSRATNAGYRWKNIAENIYAGAPNSANAAAGWIKSAGHCENLMNSVYKEMGVACTRNGATGYVTYHTQVFGTRR